MANSHDAHGHASADDQYLATPPGAGYEHTDAHVRVIVKFLVWLAIAAVLIHIGLAFLFDVFVDQRVEQGPRQYPMAVTAPRQPPAPRLQQFPREDIFNHRTAEEAILNGYGWVDKAAGTVHIPIEQAMKLALERGLPHRQSPPDPGPTPAPAARGTDPGGSLPPVNLSLPPKPSRPPEPDTLPSDASGGRVWERVR